MMSLRLGDESAKLTLYEAEAPTTVDTIWERALPWETSCAQHARFPLSEFWCDAPIVLEESENASTEVSAGEIGYSLGLPAFACWYNDENLIAPSNVFGKITTNLDGIRKEAKRTWYEYDVTMRMEKLEE